MIKAIIFDYGGVFSKEESLRKFCDGYSEKNGLDSERMKDLMIKLWLDARISNIDSDEFWKQLAGYSNKKIVDFKREFMDFFGFREELYDFVIKNLKGRYKLAILSNQIESWLEPIIDKKNFKEIFDVIVTSYGVKIAKPDIRIYEEVIKRLGVKPDECVYVDDLPDNILPAKRLGMKTILFNSFCQFREELTQILLA